MNSLSHPFRTGRLCGAVHLTEPRGPMPLKRYTAPAVLRAVQVLEHLAHVRVARTLSDLSRDLGLQKSTLHGLLGTLEEVGWLEKDGPRGGYRLGAGLLSLSRKGVGVRELREASRPLMQKLAESLGETVLLGTREGDRLVVQEVAEGRGEMRIASRPGVTLPLLAAATGKIVLAGMEPGAARTYLESVELPGFTERSASDPDVLWREVERARMSGFGVDDEEYLRGVRAVAVEVPWGQQPTALLWVVGLVSSLSLAGVEEAGQELRSAARFIARELESRA
jgi:DNA-binding IclR family transcriptional regulator